MHGMAAKRSDAGFIVVIITCPQHAAQNIATFLLEKRLAACVSSVPNVHSTFWWNGRLTNDMESLLIAKTRRKLFKQLESGVKKMHPYRNPEIISIPVMGGSADYLNWISKETTTRRSTRTRAAKPSSM